MRVLVADDHSVFRTGLRHVLRTLDGEVTVSEACSFQEALDLTTKGEMFDLILVDLLMPGMDPFDGLKSLSESCGETPIVVVSAVENRQDTLRAIDMGAMGYIPKTASGDEFMRLLRLVLDGEIVLPRMLMGRRDQKSEVQRRTPAASLASRTEHLEGLTKRQREVLALLAQGKPNLEIANDLGVSEKTVRFYISAILKSLKVSNRTQAALLAAGVLGNDTNLRVEKAS